MKGDRYKEIVDKISWKISTKKDKKTRTALLVPGIIKKYFNYAFEALMNGYPIKITRGVIIELHKEPLRALNDEEKKRYLISSRSLDYVYCLKMRGWFFDPEYTWYPSKEILSKLQEVLNSDMVYKFQRS